MLELFVCSSRDFPLKSDPGVLRGFSPRGIV
jgi:hypothetical protein